MELKTGELEHPDLRALAGLQTVRERIQQGRADIASHRHLATGPRDQASGQ
jgi:hypothetical protein